MNIAEPMEVDEPKVNTFDHHGIPFVMTNASNSLQDIFNVAMAPVLTFDGGDRSDVCSREVRIVSKIRIHQLTRQTEGYINLDVTRRK